MNKILTFILLIFCQILSAQFQNKSLDQWEPTTHPTHSYQDLEGWVTTNMNSPNPAWSPFPIISVTEENEGEIIFAKIQSNVTGIDAIGPGHIDQSISTANLKSISYTSRCDSIHLLGRCLVHIYANNVNTPLYTDTTVTTSDIFEKKTIDIDPAWINDNDVLHVRFIADGYSFQLQPEMEGYAVFSIDEVEANYITSTENKILDSNALDIFPNPSANVFNIKIEDTLQASSISVFNLLGHKVLHLTYTSTLELSNLENGVYFISVQTNRGVLSKRVTLLK